MKNRKDLTPWSNDPVPPPDPKIERPATLGEARRQIREIYDANGWDAGEQERFEKMLGLAAGPLEKRRAEDIRTILARMESSRMILYG
jgi:hypothetical protein